VEHDSGDRWTADCEWKSLNKVECVKRYDPIGDLSRWQPNFQSRSARRSDNRCDENHHGHRHAADRFACICGLLETGIRNADGDFQLPKLLCNEHDAAIVRALKSMIEGGL